MIQFLRNLVLWTKLLAVLVLLLVISSFGIWGWFWFTILFCLWLSKDSDQSPKESPGHPNKRTAGFPLPTKGYGCIGR